MSISLAECLKILSRHYLQANQGAWHPSSHLRFSAIINAISFVNAGKLKVSYYQVPISKLHSLTASKHHRLSPREIWKSSTSKTSECSSRETGSQSGDTYIRSLDETRRPSSQKGLTLNCQMKTVCCTKVLANLGHGGSASGEKVRDLNTGRDFEPC